MEFQLCHNYQEINFTFPPEYWPHSLLEPSDNEASLDFPQELTIASIIFIVVLSQKIPEAPPPCSPDTLLLLSPFISIFSSVLAYSVLKLSTSLSLLPETYSKAICFLFFVFFSIWNSGDSQGSPLVIISSAGNFDLWYRVFQWPGIAKLFRLAKQWAPGMYYTVPSTGIILIGIVLRI